MAAAGQSPRGQPGQTAHTDQELAGPARGAPTIRSVMAEGKSDWGTLAVPFRTGSAELTPTATRRLDAFRHQAAASSFRVDAFADTASGGDTSQDLAQRRADAVASYLATLGVAKDRVVRAPHGQAMAPLPRRAKVTALEN